MVFTIIFLFEEAYYVHEINEAKENALTAVVKRSNVLPIAATVLIILSASISDGIQYWKRHHLITNTPTAQVRNNSQVNLSSSGHSAKPIKPLHKATPNHIRSPHKQITPVAPSQSVLPPQHVDTGIINNAPNSGTQTVQDNRQYGVRHLPPPMSFEQRPLNPVPQDPPTLDPRENRNRMIARMSEGLMYEGNPGVALTITLGGPFYTPGFRIQCSASCLISGNSIQALEYDGIQIQSLDFSDPTMHGFMFIIPQQMQSGTKILVDLRSVDSSKIKIVGVGPYVEDIH